MNPVGSVSVLIVDDQTLLREGFQRLLELEGESIRVVGTAGDGQAALDHLAVLAAQGALPDVVLMDVRMPRLDGVAATAQITARFPTIAVIMLTTFDDEAYVVEGLRAGAKGYLLKDVTIAQLVAAIHAARRGELPLQPAIAAKLVQAIRRVPETAPPTPATMPPAEVIFGGDLTEREREILHHLAHGSSNREISEALFITEGTVKNHVSNILSKLGLRDRTQAALYAREHGLA